MADEEHRLVIVDPSLRMVTPDELVEHFNSNPEFLAYTPKEISQVLSVMAQAGHTENYRRVVDAYVGVVARDRRKRGIEVGKVALLNIARGSVGVDIDLGFRQKLPHERLFRDTYHDPETYGPAMKAFAEYLGVSGKTLVDLVFEETNQQ